VNEAIIVEPMMQNITAAREVMIEEVVVGGVDLVANPLI